MKNRTKKLTKKASVLVLTFAISLCFTFSVFATVYSNITLVRVANLPTTTVEGVKCTGVGGIGISENTNSLFAVKNATSTDNVAKFYYYPNVTNMSNVKKLNLLGAGHANAMTADVNNVYITCWTTKTPQAGNPNNNLIMKIPISVIENLTANSTIPQATSSVAGYTILTPKIINTDPATKASMPYVDFTNIINTITIHNNNGKFIIGYNIPGKNDKNYSYTTAEIINYNGQQLFVVSMDPDDMFVIKNNLKFKDGTGQDIAYTPENGFFKGVWYGDDYNPKKSVILWADIDSPTTETINYDDISYRLYTPDIIDLNMINAKYNGVPMYQKFEIESLAFTRNGKMMAGVNIENTTDYIDEYKADNGSKPPADGIFRIFNGTNGNFTVS